MADGASASDGAAPASVYADLIAWGADLPLWQNEIIRRLARQDGLTSEEVGEFADGAVMESEQQSVPYERLSVSDFPALPRTAARITLTSVGRLRHVNALMSNQEMRFGPQLTVIYGANASGKSGYSRVLKRVFRARVRDEILHDLRSDDPPGTPSALIVVQPEGEPAVRVDWVDGEALPEVFARFAVLDGSCSRTYVEGDSELTVAPEGLDIPARCAEAVDAVKKVLSDRAAARRPDKRPLQALENDSPSGRFVRSLSASTTAEKIAEHTTFNADAAELESIGVQIDELVRTSPDVLGEQLRRRLGNVQAVIDFVAAWEVLSNGAVRELRDRVEALDRAEETAQSVRSSLADDDVSAAVVGNDPWRDMIAAAARFVATTTSDSTLSVDDRCALCWQPLPEQASARLEAFATYLTGEAEKAVNVARGELGRLTEQVACCQSLTPEPVVAIARNISEEIETQLRDAGAIVQRRAGAILQALTTRQWDDLPSDSTELRGRLDSLTLDLRAQISALGDARDVHERAEELRRRQLELETRRRLAGQRDDLTAFVHDLIASQRYDAIAKGFSTRGISEKAEELERKYRTAEFESRFEHELRRELRFARHPPVFHKRTSKAKTLLTPVVSAKFRNVKAAEVFSEGERTAISLAAVLAEVSITKDTAGMIFDDPISSLDHDVRERVAARLVREAKERQIIVLTHDLAFFADLRVEADIQGVECRTSTLSADEWVAGRVEADMPFGMRSVNERLKELKRMITAVEVAGKAGDRGTVESLTRLFYDRLRSTWERFVEEKMFAKAVVRLEKNVRPGLLDGAVVTRQISQNVNQGYKRCSEVIEAHDHAAGVGTPSLTTADMRADIQFLEETNALVKAELASRKAE